MSKKTAKRNSESKIKDATVQLRMRLTDKAKVVKAARLCETTLSKFILDNALRAAQQVLADQVQFALSARDWNAFCRALDAPPRVIPILRKLISQPSILDAEFINRQIHRSSTDG